MTLTFLQGDCLQLMRDMPDDHFDMVIGSPPYVDARLYLENGQNLGIARNVTAWVDWMLEISEQAVRICRGPVFWVVAGNQKKFNYQPGPEGLVWEWFKRGNSQYCPCVFHRVGIPGSGGQDGFRKDWEYVLWFKRPGKLPWSDNTACGHPPRWAPGGEMSNRLSNGARVNQRGHGIDSGATVTLDGKQVRSKGKRPSHRLQRENEKATAATQPVLANPGNVIHCNVGGGVMGHKLAHENEAPYPTKLVERFVRSFCPEGGHVLDPFIGSGTTAQVCQEWGRHCTGIDLRQSQIELCRKRCLCELRMF